MQLDDFIRRYGGIYEHSPWVAERAFERVGEGDLGDILAACVDEASRERKLELIRAHPDLAGRAAIAGELTEASSDEQRSARLDQCTVDEYARFQSLNHQYHERFGFPFVMAVRQSSRQEILAAFEARLGNQPDEEFERAIEEIHKIARLRLEAM